MTGYDRIYEMIGDTDDAVLAADDAVKELKQAQVDLSAAYLRVSKAIDAVAAAVQASVIKSTGCRDYAPSEIQDFPEFDEAVMLAVND